jgi:tetratricopeptide (TPR) repeat protein
MNWRIESPQELAAASGRSALDFGAFDVSPPRLDWGGRPWVLFLGSDERMLEAAAADWLATRVPPNGLSQVLIPPEGALLPLSLEQLRKPELPAGSRYLFIPRLDRHFFNTLSGQASFSLVSPLYLLPRLVRAANGGESVGFVATADRARLAAHGADVLAGRGLAARFEIYRQLTERPAEVQEGSGARADLETLLQSEASFERFLEFGLGEREPADREKSYRHALRLAPDSAVAHLCLASALVEQMRLDEATAAQREALRIAPDFPAAHYELAKLLIRTDDLAGAAAGFRRTAELVPEFGSAWSNLGAVLGEMEDFDGAVQALEQAVALDPLSHALHSNLGVTFRNLGRYDEAAAEFRMTLELSPDFVFGHYNLAHNSYLQGRYAEAIALFERARELDAEKSPRQGLLLAAVRLASGDVAGAERDYREILGALEGQKRNDLIAVAEWDLAELERQRKPAGEIRETLALLRSLG